MAAAIPPTPTPPTNTDAPTTARVEASTSLRRFPCKQCGAKLEYAPGTTSLVCPYCNAANDIGVENVSEQHLELDYLDTLKKLRDAAPDMDVPIVKCDACNAEIEVPEKAVSFACPFCSSNIVSQARASTLVKPNAILPFDIPRDRAIAAFRAWLSSRWFAPSALKHDGKLDASVTGVYLPAWTYDSKTTTPYSGMRGDAYYETQWGMVNGQRQSRQVRKIRWSPAAGTVRVDFDDMLVEASHSLPPDEIDHLRPWDTKGVVPYKDEFLAGFRAEAYGEVTLERGFAQAARRMDQVIDRAICNDIGGDEQRIESKRTRHDAITFKHLLLPVWISAYRYRNKVYRFLVNARTGQVHGDRPYSVWKITGLIVVIIIVLLILVLILNAR